jgi:hypothetical protein
MNYHGPSTLDDAWLIAIDGQGFVEWQRCYGGIYYEDFKSLVQMEDSNVIYGLGAAGDINGDVLASYGNGDGWICKIDANTGLLLKSRNYGGSNADQFLRSAKLNKNSFLAMAQTYSQDHDVWMSYSTINQEGWLLNIDTALNIVWQKTIGSTGDAYLYDVINTKDGGFLLIGGTTNSPGDTSSFNFYVNNRQEEVYMLKYDSLGNELGQYHYGAPVDHVYFHGGIVEMQDGGYVFSANVNRWNGFALSPFNKGTVLFRTNSAGSLISTSRYGNGVSATLSLFNLFTTPDNGLVTFGGGVTCHQNAWGAMRIGNQLGLTDQEQLDFPIKLYPNPSSGIFNLSIETNENIERVVIFNSLGQQIGGLHKQASNRYTINLSGESKGIYFVVMEIGEELVYRKLVLE